MSIHKPTIIDGMDKATAQEALDIVTTETNNGDSGATETINWSGSNAQKTTISEDCTYTFTAPGRVCGLVLKLVQGTGGGFNPTWPATVKWAGGVEPTWSTAAAAIDIISFYHDGTNYYGAASVIGAA